MKKFKLNGSDKEALDEFLLNNELEVWNLILDAIQYCIENKLDEKQVFEVDPEVDKLFVFRSTFKTTLERGIKVFERYEDYEKCSISQNILGAL